MGNLPKLTRLIISTATEMWLNILAYIWMN